jgi:tetratricopeptide (TPR) repeat protein
VVLEEFDGPAGALLWKSLRTMLIWTEADPHERPRLFLPGAKRRRLAALRAAELDGALLKPLRVLARALDRSASISPEPLAKACRQLSEWADQQGALATALAFMQVAALLVPDDAEAAYLTGRLARRRAEYARAETWFHQAITVARQNADWRAYALAFIGLGNLHLQRGNFPAARKSHTTALKTARKHGLREIEGMASHDLFVIADESNQVREAEVHAANALHAYGAGHPRLPNLAHDLACLWMNQGQFARALSVIRAALSHIRQPRDRSLALGSLGRAAGAAGDAAGFDAAWNQFWQASETDTSAEGAAQALLALAQGAASLHDWDRAEHAAGRALEIASLRKESQVQILAEAVLESIRHGRLARASVHQLPEHPTEEADALAGEFVAALQDLQVEPV